MEAIDIHAHPSTRPWYESMRPFFEALEAYYKTPFRVRTDEEMAEEFRRAGIGAMIIAWDAESTTKLPATTNDYAASLRDRFPGAIIGAWASVDPWKGEDAVRELERAVRELKKEIAGRLQDKVMFGSDYPVLTHERLFRDWDVERYPTAVLEKVFLSNARRILRLG